MSDDELRKLLPRDGALERALDLRDHERAERQIRADARVQGSLAEIKDGLQTGEHAFHYRPKPQARARRAAEVSDVAPPSSGVPASSPSGTLLGVGDAKSQSSPPAPPEDRVPESGSWTKAAEAPGSERTVGGRTERMLVAPKSEPAAALGKLPAGAEAQSDLDATLPRPNKWIAPAPKIEVPDPAVLSSSSYAPTLPHDGNPASVVVEAGPRASERRGKAWMLGAGLLLGAGVLVALLYNGVAGGGVPLGATSTPTSTPSASSEQAVGPARSSSAEGAAPAPTLSPSVEPSPATSAPKKTSAPRATSGSDPWDRPF